MKPRRIGVAIQTQHVHAEDQQIYSGIRDYSRDHEGFLCVMAPFATEDLLHAPRHRPAYDGILAQATQDLLEQAAQCGVPVVNVGLDSARMDTVSCVLPDFAKAGRMVGQHFVTCGFEHFAYVVNRTDQAQLSMCEEKRIGGDALGFAAYVNARGFACDSLLAPKTVYSSADVWNRWSRTIRAWLQQAPKPLALFVPRDLLCRHIADIIQEIGLHIPNDIGLTCADNESNICLLSSPSLTAVDLGYRRVGYEAAALLDAQLQAGTAGARQPVIRYVEPHALFSRESTDATAVKDPLVAVAMRYIVAHAHEPIQVADVARQVSATRRTLERRFRDVLDRTVMQEITRCRLDRLKRQLAQTDTPIKILTMESGFNSPRVLYETFVREEGLSPSAYRNRRQRRR